MIRRMFLKLGLLAMLFKSDDVVQKAVNELKSRGINKIEIWDVDRTTKIVIGKRNA